MTQSAAEKLDEALDKKLLEALKDEPTAAILNVARQRLKDLNFNKVPTGEDAASEMAEALGFRQNPNVLKMPGLDEEPDEAVG